MRARFALLAVLAALLPGLLFAAPTAGAQESGSLDGEPPAYVPGIEDLPLMPGLEEIPSAGVAFDATTGRIVESYAKGPVTEPAALAFYQQTLPQLGWRQTAPDAFVREGESLHLTFEPDGEELTVRFRLSPE